MDAQAKAKGVPFKSGSSVIRALGNLVVIVLRLFSVIRPPVIAFMNALTHNGIHSYGNRHGVSWEALRRPRRRDPNQHLKPH